MQLFAAVVRCHCMLPAATVAVGQALACSIYFTLSIAAAVHGCCSLQQLDPDVSACLLHQVSIRQLHRSCQRICVAIACCWLPLAAAECNRLQLAPGAEDCRCGQLLMADANRCG